MTPLIGKRIDHSILLSNLYQWRACFGSLILPKTLDRCPNVSKNILETFVIDLRWSNDLTMVAKLFCIFLLIIKTSVNCFCFTSRCSCLDLPSFLTTLLYEDLQYCIRFESTYFNQSLGTCCQSSLLAGALTKYSEGLRWIFIMT